MSSVNDSIRKKLEALPPHIYKLAMEAIKLSESGLSETAIAEQLGNVVREIIRKKEM